MKRTNTSRQTIAASQRNVNYRPNFAIAQHVLDATISVPGLEGSLIIRKAGRSFSVNGLVVRKGETVVLVASTKFAGRFYVCHNHQWSTNDQAVIAKCRAAILKRAA